MKPGVISPEAGMVIARKQLTLEDFLALPDRKPPLEFVDGEVTPKMAPVTEHVVL